jgi:HD superfamily phosphohydrolase
MVGWKMLCAVAETSNLLTMSPRRPSSSREVADLISTHLAQNPELGGIRGLAQKTGISYDSLQKYAKGLNLPPTDKWMIIHAELTGTPRPSTHPVLFDRASEGEKETKISIMNDPKPNPSSASPRPGGIEEQVTPMEGAVKQENDRHSNREDRQEFYIPVHGFVWFYPEEVPIIDHPAFQRLSGLHQLGMAYVVYRGATHRRFEHALGTVWVAQRMLEAISHNCAKRHTKKPDLKDEWIRGSKPTMWEERFIRLGALLHDIGHVPFGHTFEDELHLLNKHDELERIDRILNRADWYDNDGRSVTNGDCPTGNEEDLRETLRDRINRLYRKYLPPELREELKAADVLKQIVIKPPKNESATDKTSRLEMERHTASAGLRINICRDIVGNTICADLLDYLHRDWYHIGKQRHFDERIFHYMEIRTPIENAGLAINKEPAPTDRDAFVISIGNWPRLRSDGVSAIMELLESRYQLAEAVLFHRTKMAATSMLERTLSLAFAPEEGGDHPFDLEGWLLENSEELLLPNILSGSAAFNKTQLSPTREKRWQRSRKIASKMLRRELHELLLMVAYDEVKGRDADFIQKTYANGSDAALNRARALHRLEEDFGLESGTVTMYCPESRMNSKIAQVQIFVENSVSAFDSYEEKHGNPLSAGHLTAQLNRFKSLWRIVFFIDPAVRKAKGDKFISLLVKAIRAQVLLLHNREDTIDSVVADIAQRVVQIPTFHLRGKPVLSDPKQMKIARSGKATPTTYPSGAPSLLRFIGDERPATT